MFNSVEGDFRNMFNSVELTMHLQKFRCEALNLIKYQVMLFQIFKQKTKQNQNKTKQARFLLAPNFGHTTFGKPLLQLLISTGTRVSCFPSFVIYKNINPF